MTLRNSPVLENDNNKSSRDSALFGVYHDELSRLKDSSSVITIESTSFGDNGDLFSTIEDCSGCGTQTLSMRSDNSSFADNYGSTLGHRYYSDLVAMIITFDDCQWPSAGGHLVARDEGE